MTVSPGPATMVAHISGKSVRSMYRKYAPLRAKHQRTHQRKTLIHLGQGGTTGKGYRATSRSGLGLGLVGKAGAVSAASPCLWRACVGTL